MSIYAYKIFNEVYFQNNRIDELQRCITNYRNDLWKNKSLIKKFNTHPEIIKFNRLCEDIFGFKRFSLTVIPYTGMVNAMTCPIGILLDSEDPKKYIESTKNGFRYKKGNQYCADVCIFSDLVTRKDITDREVMAIIMHEIGHNFQEAITSMNTGLLVIKKLLIFKDIVLSAMMGNIESLMTIILSTNTTINIEQKISEFFINKIPNVIDMIDFIKKLNSILIYLPNKVLSKALAPLQLYFTSIQYISDPTKIGLLTMNYKDEKISDNFATMYGYGPDLASALTKITYQNDYIEDLLLNRIPIVSPIIGLYDSVIGILISGIDCHPNLLSRIDYQIEYLKMELKDCDPKMAKEIKKQIDDIEDIMYGTILKSRSIKDKNLFDKLYLSFIYNILGKGQVKELFIGKNIHSEIENTFNKTKK